MANYLDVADLYTRLSVKENIKIKSAEDIHKRNFQWLEDIKEEAKALFRKECKKRDQNAHQEKSETVNSIQENPELEDSGCSTIIPVLLPKTPREKQDRADRIGKRIVSGRRPSFSTSRSCRAASKTAHARIKNNLKDNLRKKKRRPTENAEKTTDINEYTSSITTEEEPLNSEEEKENAIPARSSGYSTMSQISSVDTNRCPINKQHDSDNASVSDSNLPESEKVPTLVPGRVLRSQSSAFTSETESEDAPVIRRSARNQKRIQTPRKSNSPEKRIRVIGPSPNKATQVKSLKVTSGPGAMGHKAVSLASLRHPIKTKNTLHSSIKDGKNASTSALIVAAKGAASGMKTNNTRKMTPQSPLKDSSGINAALGIIGSGNRHHYSSNYSSGASGTLNKMRSRIGNIQKSPLLSATKSGGNLLNIRSFLPQKPAKAVKPTAEEIQAKKLEELNEKKLKEDEALRKKEEAAKAKQEEKRLKNEARQKRVQEARQTRERQKIQEAERIEKEKKERHEVIVKARQIAEEQRRLQQEEKRKKEIEQERNKMEEERKRKQLDEEKREQLKLRQLEEEKRRKQEEQRKQEIINQEQAKREVLQAIQTRLNETYDKDGSGNHNRTFTVEDQGSRSNANTTNSYEITPARHELPPEELLDENNYDIAELRSDEETDDDDNPRKQVPKWADGPFFNKAILIQTFQPPNLDEIFVVQEATPDLVEIFSEHKRVFHKRTSSRLWEPAPNSHLNSTEKRKI